MYVENSKEEADLETWE